MPKLRSNAVAAIASVLMDLIIIAVVIWVVWTYILPADASGWKTLLIIAAVVYIAYRILSGLIRAYAVWVSSDDQYAEAVDTALAALRAQDDTALPHIREQFARLDDFQLVNEAQSRLSETAEGKTLAELAEMAEPGLSKWQRNYLEAALRYEDEWMVQLSGAYEDVALDILRLQVAIEPSHPAGEGTLSLE